MYDAYGAKRSASEVDTPYRYTGQRWEENDALDIYYYRARWYDPQLGRFLQPDTIVPEAGNPQSLNRYAYALNNPVKYTDPNGHDPTGIAFFIYQRGNRVLIEAPSLVFPSANRGRRDAIGGQFVTKMDTAIRSQASERGISPILVAAILRHESAAFERRLVTSFPLTEPGIEADLAEAAQTLMKGDQVSIGPGQMQPHTAQTLEDLGYVASRASDLDRVLSLLSDAGAVEYVAGEVAHIGSELSKGGYFQGLTTEQQFRLTLIGYNQGWTDGFQKILAERGSVWVIESYKYDNETLDEYLRWRASNDPQA